MVGYEQPAAFWGQRCQAVLHALKPQVRQQLTLPSIAIRPGIDGWVRTWIVLYKALLFPGIPPRFLHHQSSHTVKVAVGIGRLDLFPTSNSSGYAVDGFVRMLLGGLRTMAGEEGDQASPDGFVLFASVVLIRIEPRQELSEAFWSQ